MKQAKNTPCADRRQSALPGGPRTRQRGLTLVELMIGLTVVAIVAAVGVPNFRNFVADQNRVIATNDLLSALHLARSEALKLSRHVTV